MYNLLRDLIYVQGLAILSLNKIFLIDTSVLLYDKNSIHSFPGVRTVIPLVVLDELDRFKEKTGVLGENARYVNRFLDEIRGLGNLNEGVALENGQEISVERNFDQKIPADLNRDGGDNHIIGVARFLKSRNIDKEITVVTKDINLRVKCDSLGIKAEDYYKDRIVIENDSIYKGWRSFNLDSPDPINNFFENGSIPYKSVCDSLCENEYVIAKHGNQSMMGIKIGENICPLICDTHDLVPILARNKEQKFTIDMLTRDSIKLCTITGRAGSGKTFLTLLSAISGLQSQKYKRIVVTRSLEPVGNSIGYLPGDLNEKLDPWIGSIVDNFKNHFGDLTYFHLMREKGNIEIAPLAFIRGRTFNDAFIIVDEAQNSTIHELKTIVTRVGEGSKIVLMGDTDQIDTQYIDTYSNGLTIILEKLKDENITGHVTLMKGERSELATLASKLI